MNKKTDKASDDIFSPRETRRITQRKKKDEEEEEEKDN